jgi:putative Ca2+/H+ antiporter (TMEM165/GDT1 family)
MLTVSLAGLLVVLAVVGGLELVDRTSFALIALAARTRALGAWAGGATAFILTTCLAVAIGAGLEAAIGAAGIRWLRLAGGLFLIGYAAYTLRAAAAEEQEAVVGWRGAFAAAFATIFLLELGDTTMIFEIVLVPTAGWLAVLLGGSLALVVVAAWDVWLGQRLSLHLDARTVARVVSAILFLVGALTVVYALAPNLFPTL